MAPSARIVHRVPGRTRLRTQGMRGNQGYFTELQAALSQSKGVQSVRVNALTQSILIQHESAIEEVMLEAERRGYLRLEAAAPEPYLVQIDRALASSDEKLRQATSGRVDLKTLTFLGFVAGGVYQVAKGHALPAGVTLLRYAVELVGSAGVASLQKRARALQAE
jgi:hypothetical protein